MAWGKKDDKSNKKQAPPPPAKNKSNTNNEGPSTYYPVAQGGAQWNYPAVPVVQQTEQAPMDLRNIIDNNGRHPVSGNCPLCKTSITTRTERRKNAHVIKESKKDICIMSSVLGTIFAVLLGLGILTAVLTETWWWIFPFLLLGAIPLGILACYIKSVKSKSSRCVDIVHFCSNAKCKKLIGVSDGYAEFNREGGCCDCGHHHTSYYGGGGGGYYGGGGYHGGYYGDDYYFDPYYHNHYDPYWNHHHHYHDDFYHDDYYGHHHGMMGPHVGVTIGI